MGEQIKWCENDHLGKNKNRSLGTQPTSLENVDYVTHTAILLINTIYRINTYVSFPKIIRENASHN